MTLLDPGDEVVFKPDWKKPLTKKRHEAQIRNSSKRVYTRRGKDLTCVICGGEFYVSPYHLGRKYCSKACSNLARPSKKTTKCSVCFGVMPTERSEYAKTCSDACRNESVSRSKRGDKNPAYTNGSSAAKMAWRNARGAACEWCEGADRLRSHHVVYEQTVRGRHGDIWDPRNLMTLCMTCHHLHHAAGENRLDVSLLSERNLDFAVDLLGAGAFDYFARRYNGAFEDIAQRLKPHLEVRGEAEALSRYYPRLGDTVDPGSAA